MVQTFQIVTAVCLGLFAGAMLLIGGALVLPKPLRDLVGGLKTALEDKTWPLRYLGPLRSYPLRHVAFSRHHDSFAGGGLQRLLLGPPFASRPAHSSRARKPRSVTRCQGIVGRRRGEAGAVRRPGRRKSCCRGIAMAPESVNEQSGHAVRILVVDDERGVRQSLRYLLETAGYVVFEAPDGRDVVEKVLRDGIALVITDLFMPNREGMETITALRRACPAVPVIAISAHGPQYLKAAQGLGACRALTKPFESEQFLETVAEVLGLPRAA
jgi:CheY-like chemotaxis protein